MKKGKGRRLALIAAVFFVVAAAGVLAGPRLSGLVLRQLYPLKFAETVEREAQEFQLPQELVFAVIRAESGFDPKACSRADAKGLMQLTEPTFYWMAEEYPPENGGRDVYDINDNVHCGCALLRRLLDHYGDAAVALAAYNAGIGNVDRWLEEREHSEDGKTLKKIPYPETAAYVKKVERNWGVYRELYGF